MFEMTYVTYAVGRHGGTYWRHLFIIASDFADVNNNVNNKCQTSIIDLPDLKGHNIHNVLCHLST